MKSIAILGIIVLSLIKVQHTSGFNFPTFESLSELFGVGEHAEGSEDEVKERVKRQRNAGDECSDVWKACSSTLPRDPDAEEDEEGNKPINFRYMPTLANGHLGFIPYRPVMYLNGLYNGQGGDSHRAQIPNIIMAKVEMSSRELERQTIRKYVFNAKEGTFTEEIESEFAFIKHRMYVHQRYTKLLICDIEIEPKTNIRTGGVIHLEYPDAEVSPDIDFEPAETYEGNWKLEGTTKVAETGQARDTIHIYYTHPIREIAVRGEAKREILIMAVDRQHSAALTQFELALGKLYSHGNRGIDMLLNEHKEAWAATWADGSLEVVGYSLVAKLVNFAQYYLLSNLPALKPYEDPQRDEYHYGVSRSGLGHGSKGKNHQGHVMWDSEMYVLPAVLPFHPFLAKRMLRYRTALAEVAAQNAQARGEKGMRFPWESAYSGIDVTPDNTCRTCSEQQIHVSGAVAYAIRQYFSLTRDRDFITNQDYKGCDVMREIAKFYAEKASYSSKKGRYSINDVMGPDDYHESVDNNAYTNVLASLAIHYARYINCMCNRNARSEVPDDYLQVALYLELPYNNEKRLHYAYDGYKKAENNTIKQADTLLLAYPLNWNMSRDIMKNDLEYYENRFDPKTPAMTYSFMSVGWKFVEDYSKMESFFLKSYQDYLVQPFKVWTEYNEGNRQDRARSTVNFLPGMGAFLQSIMYGYAGVRIRPESLEFHDPRVPSGALELRLKNFHYLESTFTVTIFESQRVTVQVHTESNNYPLVLMRNSSRGGKESMRRGELITIDDAKNGFFIFTEAGTPCEHPRDYIYMPWGYSPWISAADSPIIAHRPCAFVLLWCSLAFMLMRFILQ